MSDDGFDYAFDGTDAMTDLPQGPVPGSRILRWAARLVPRPKRDVWRREWEAETAYAWRRMNAEGSATWLAVQRLRLRAAASWMDAARLTLVNNLDAWTLAVRSL